MENEFWIQAWKEGQTRFHLSEINPNLLNYVDQNPKLTQEKMNIFVPLCGKTLDLIFLRDLGHNVYGIELSQLAVEEFFKQNDISYKIKDVGDLKAYCSKGITIYLGDFFKLTKDLLSNIGLIYDRAAIVALPESMRKIYFEKLTQLLEKETKILMISFERVPQTDHGPPHSIPRQEIVNYCEGNFLYKVLNESKEKINSSKLQEVGITHMTRIIFELTKL